MAPLSRTLGATSMEAVPPHRRSQVLLRRLLLRKNCQKEQHWMELSQHRQVLYLHWTRQPFPSPAIWIW